MSGPGRPFALLSRRGLLKGLLAGGGTLAAGAGGLLALRGSAPAVEGLRALDAHGYRTFAALARAAFPDLRPGGALEATLDLARAFDGYLADEPAHARAEARQALTLLEFGPLVFERRLATFSNLAPDEALAHFATWGASPREVQRQVASGFRRFMAMVFYDQPAVWPSIGYDGPLIKAPGAP